jgi:hypothetical protein
VASSLFEYNFWVISQREKSPKWETLLKNHLRSRSRM